MINSYSIYLDGNIYLRQNFGHLKWSSSIDEIKLFMTFNLRGRNLLQGAYIKYHIDYSVFYVRVCRNIKIHDTSAVAVGKT